MGKEGRSLLVGAVGLICSGTSFGSPPTLKLYTFSAPPYQVTHGTPEDQQISGKTTLTITCAVEKAGWRPSIQVTPQRRAVHSLARNLVDGYFAVDPSSSLDAIAKRSDPVSLEKWYFFSLTPPPSPRQARIGVVAGSNEHNWLKANGYTVFLEVSSASQLLALLERGRIDLALLDERVMASQERQNRRLHATFVRYAPLHLYLAEAFTHLHPEFLPGFNRALPVCAEDSLTLSAEEQQRIRALATELVEELNAAINLQQALTAGPGAATPAEVLKLDRQWQATAPVSASELAEDILELPASDALNGWQQSHPSLVTEVLLIDQLGAIRAMSQLTSDYWQGDEPKFTQLVNPADGIPTDLYISPIRYDASTRRFQITVSAPIPDREHGSAAGVIAFGLNIEPALQTGNTPEIMGGQPHTLEQAPRILRNR
ncbi:transporter substrate-binding domain-containing protein [Marinobacter salinexigens]|uniref:Transporter substrate-binding domain-containing protein n=1 Tax=Marinobacter salinexigens TaxID=2919747 RepID=A0A5B0VNJ9_9GAMM|nr:transporter substrate-binding domain-containing protein [Marinobacter salinexigens]KAA1175948.1 transporter substrate-binding domain-containing protein [Marinobacter salinexigens]